MLLPGITQRQLYVQISNLNVSIFTHLSDRWSEGINFRCKIVRSPRLWFELLFWHMVHYKCRLLTYFFGRDNKLCFQLEHRPVCTSSSCECRSSAKPMVSADDAAVAKLACGVLVLSRWTTSSVAETSFQPASWSKWYWSKELTLYNWRLLQTSANYFTNIA